MSAPDVQQHAAALQAEVATLRNLRHEKLAAVHGLCVEDGTGAPKYIVSELGKMNFRTYAKSLTQRLSLVEFARISSDILNALVFLHSLRPAPRVHGALKPENMLVFPVRDNVVVVKLADAGLARFASLHGLPVFATSDSSAYAAPEQFSRTPRFDSKTDMFSFGVTMCEVVLNLVAPAGGPAFNPSDTDASIAAALAYLDSVSPPLAAFLRGCCAEDASERFTSSAALEALTAATAGKAASGYAPATVVDVLQQHGLDAAASALPPSFMSSPALPLPDIMSALTSAGVTVSHAAKIRRALSSLAPVLIASEPVEREAARSTTPIEAETPIATSIEGGVPSVTPEAASVTKTITGFAPATVQDVLRAQGLEATITTLPASFMSSPVSALSDILSMLTSTGLSVSSVAKVRRALSALPPTVAPIQDALDATTDSVLPAKTVLSAPAAIVVPPGEHALQAVLSVLSKLGFQDTAARLEPGFIARFSAPVSDIMSALTVAGLGVAAAAKVRRALQSLSGDAVAATPVTSAPFAGAVVTASTPAVPIAAASTPVPTVSVPAGEYSIQAVLSTLSTLGFQDTAAKLEPGFIARFSAPVSDIMSALTVAGLGVAAAAKVRRALQSSSSDAAAVAATPVTSAPIAGAVVTASTPAVPIAAASTPVPVASVPAGEYSIQAVLSTLSTLGFQDTAPKLEPGFIARYSAPVSDIMSALTVAGLGVAAAAKVRRALQSSSSDAAAVAATPVTSVPIAGAVVTASTPVVPITAASTPVPAVSVPAGEYSIQAVLSTLSTLGFQDTAAKLEPGFIARFSAPVSDIMSALTVAGLGVAAAAKVRRALQSSSSDAAAVAATSVTSVPVASSVSFDVPVPVTKPAAAPAPAPNPAAAPAPAPKPAAAPAPAPKPAAAPAPAPKPAAAPAPAPKPAAAPAPAPKPAAAPAPAPKPAAAPAPAPKPAAAPAPTPKPAAAPAPAPKPAAAPAPAPKPAAAPAPAPKPAAAPAPAPKPAAAPAPAPKPAAAPAPAPKPAAAPAPAPKPAAAPAPAPKPAAAPAPAPKPAAAPAPASKPTEASTSCRPQAILDAMGALGLERFKKRFRSEFGKQAQVSIKAASSWLSASGLSEEEVAELMFVLDDSAPVLPVEEATVPESWLKPTDVIAALSVIGFDRKLIDQFSAECSSMVGLPVEDVGTRLEGAGLTHEQAREVMFVIGNEAVQAYDAVFPPVAAQPAPVPADCVAPQALADAMTALGFNTFLGRLPPDFMALPYVTVDDVIHRLTAAGMAKEQGREVMFVLGTDAVAAYDALVGAPTTRYPEVPVGSLFPQALVDAMAVVGCEQYSLRLGPDFSKLPHLTLHSASKRMTAAGLTPFQIKDVILVLHDLVPGLHEAAAAQAVSSSAASRAAGKPASSSAAKPVTLVQAPAVLIREATAPIGEHARSKAPRAAAGVSPSHPSMIGYSPQAVLKALADMGFSQDIPMLGPVFPGALWMSWLDIMKRVLANGVSFQACVDLRARLGPAQPAPAGAPAHYHLGEAHAAPGADRVFTPADIHSAVDAVGRADLLSTVQAVTAGRVDMMLHTLMSELMRVGTPVSARIEIRRHLESMPAAGEEKDTPPAPAPKPVPAAKPVAPKPAAAPAPAPKPAAAPAPAPKPAAAPAARAVAHQPPPKTAADEAAEAAKAAKDAAAREIDELIGAGEDIAGEPANATPAVLSAWLIRTSSEAFAGSLPVQKQVLKTFLALANSVSGKPTALATDALGHTFALMETHTDKSSLVELGCNAIASLASGSWIPVAQMQRCMQALLRTLTGHATVMSVQRQGIIAIARLITAEGAASSFMAIGGLPVLLAALKAHPNSKPIQSHGFTVLSALAAHPDSKSVLNDAAGIAVIITYLSAEGINEAQALAILDWIQPTSADAVRVLVHSGLFKCMVTILSTPAATPRVLLRILALLRAMFDLDAVHETVLKQGVFSAVIGCMSRRTADAGLCEAVIDFATQLASQKKLQPQVCGPQLLDAIADAMRAHGRLLSVLIPGFTLMASLAQHPDNASKLERSVIPIIVALDAHPVLRLHALGYTIILDLLAHSKAASMLASAATGVTTIVRTLTAFPRELDLNICALRLLSQLLWSGQNAQPFVAAKGVPLVLTAMDLFSDHPTVQSVACSSLAGLMSAKAEYQHTVDDAGGLGSVLAAMDAFPTDVTLMMYACAFISNFAHCSTLNVAAANADASFRVVAAMRAHPYNVELIEQACHALCRMAVNPDSLAPMLEANVLPAILQAMKTHLPHERVQDLCARILYALSLHRTHAPVVKDSKAVHRLKRASAAHKRNVDLRMFCELALEQLQ